MVAKPLNDEGALPPLSEFTFDHWLSEYVTVAPGVALRSPTTKAPPFGNANTIVDLVSADAR